MTITWKGQPRLIWVETFGFILPDPNELNVIRIISPTMYAFGNIAVNVLAEYHMDRRAVSLKLDTANAEGNLGMQCVFTVLIPSEINECIPRRKGVCFGLPAVIASEVTAYKEQVCTGVTGS